MTEPSCYEMSTRLCRTGSCSPTSLLTFLEQQNLRAFQEALDTYDSDPNIWIGDPHLLSILDLACKKDRTGDFVRELLKRGADPSIINTIRKKAPIHFAAEAGNLEALTALLEDPRTDKDDIDSFGNTALHLLSKQQYSVEIGKCLQLLLHNGVKVNKINRKGKTAIYLAANEGEQETVTILLKYGRANLDAEETYDQKTARDLILKRMPGLELMLPEKGNLDDNENGASRLFSLLYTRQSEGFGTLLESLLKVDENKSKQILNSHDGWFTLLQYASYNGLNEVVTLLLDKGADPDAVSPYEEKLPSLLAATEGNYEILDLFINQDADFTSKCGQTALHIVIEGAEHLRSKQEDYQICFDLLLDKLVKNAESCKIDINSTDRLGNTALHIAARNGNEYFILRLMEHGAYIGSLNCFGEPPLANIPSKLLEKFLNGRLTTNDKSPRDENYEIKFDYKFLAPPVTPYTATPHGGISLPVEDPPPSPVPECQPLLYISRTPDLRHLLKHPIFTSFLELKWRGIRPFFYVNLIFYLIFVTLITVYILFIYELSAETPIKALDSKIDSEVERSWFTNEENKTHSIQNKSNTQPTHESVCVWTTGEGIWCILTFYFICLILRELFQLIVSPVHYLKSPENYLEILLIIASGLVLFYRCADATTRPHLSAITILLSWAELVLLIGRHPRLSTNIEMLKTVSMNFLQFLAWYSILIIAFALSFYTLFRSSTEDDNFFLDPGSSFFKTVVMVTGEFDAADLPFVLFPGTSHVVFVLFVFLVAIVLFNLLNGLAVSDTHAIKEDAELVSIVSRIKLVSYTESILLGHPFWCRDRAEYDCCCCTALSRIRTLSFTSLPILVQKVRLFPAIIPNRTISVLPNQFSQIITIHPGNDKKNLRKNDACYKSGQCHGEYVLDSRILKDASKILAIRGQLSDAERTRTILGKTQEQHILKIHDLENKFHKIEKSCNETRKLLEQILKILQKSADEPFSPKL